MYSLLDNYNFTYPKDKQLLEQFLQKLNLSDKDLSEILEIYLKKYSGFDTRILYNPIELVDALLENDLS
jgi:prenyltransferase beta subunit